MEQGTLLLEIPSWQQSVMVSLHLLISTFSYVLFIYFGRFTLQQELKKNRFALK